MNPQLRLLKWREGLLDLTRRNRLIHFNPDVSLRVRSPHGVQLAKPDIETLWNRLALHEKLQGFYELESEAETLDGDEFEANLFAAPEHAVERVPPPERPLGPNELRAFPDGAKLSRTLSNLRTRAQTSLTEQGLNTLFVAFGFLRWRDKDDREMLSPLFLVPVELLRKSPRDPFKMRGRGEEVVLNPALQLKLKNDFGLEFPADLPTVEGQAGRSVEAQLRQIESAVRARFGQWRVEPLVFLGLFSFHKIAMFNDLGDNSAPLAAHPLVRAVCGEQGALASYEIIAAEQLDGLPAAEAQLVVEADSSQHRAIVAARRGASFVLQGPPGTGKSQTITNIIAECLENGKTVLFVSEKMAALDVVLGRLRDIGLGDSCLELHSSKTNKRDVIYEIGRTLMLDAPAPLSSPDESHELVETVPNATPASEVQNGDVESILAFCETAGLPQLSLLWHYRSRHEELIAFSNRHFYEARLQTFPAPARAGAGALQWIKVGGFYRPSGAGAGREGGTNRIEARHVARMVATHASQAPHLSLGIITFNEPQRRAVEEEITRLRLRDDELDAFLDEDADEPFFVKALENVQGDERDAIFFSVGFGPRKGENGQSLPMRMTFGPLTKEGGERRLNVAVTRAKHQVKIVTSFDPGEIRVEKLKYKGGKLLRSYLEWAGAAKNGALHDGAPNADDLARAVASALEKRGWNCALHVGLGEYRVDVGVSDARAPEEMKLGIVLDGPFYTGAATVRDRDRLRPMVLQRLGWDLWPLWSLDCAREFERQIEKIDAHLRATG